MIEGTNKSTGITDEEFEDFASKLGDITSTTDVIDNLIQRRNNLLNGGVNCIPLPFKRFRSEVPGVEQGTYVLVTANAKVGKKNKTTKKKS